MTADDSRRTTRRTLLQCGLVSTGALVGASSRSRAASRSNATDERSTASTLEGVMFPYQVAAGRRATVLETDLEWHPGRLESAYRTHVIAYDHAPSLRAFLFADGDVSAGQSVALESGTGARRATPDRFVTVGVDPLES